MRQISRDLGAAYDNKTTLAGRPQSDVKRPVSIWVRNVGFVGLIFEMLGDRNTIQSVPLCFLDADVGPDRTIGKDGVHVQVTREA